MSAFSKKKSIFNIDLTSVVEQARLELFQVISMAPEEFKKYFMPGDSYNLVYKDSQDKEPLFVPGWKYILTNSNGVNTVVFQETPEIFGLFLVSTVWKNQDDDAPIYHKGMTKDVKLTDEGFDLVSELVIYNISHALAYGYPSRYHSLFKTNISYNAIYIETTLLLNRHNRVFWEYLINNNSLDIVSNKTVDEVLAMHYRDFLNYISYLISIIDKHHDKAKIEYCLISFFFKKDSVLMKMLDEIHDNVMEVVPNDCHLYFPEMIGNVLHIIDKGDYRLLEWEALNKRNISVLDNIVKEDFNFLVELMKL